ncbi:cupin domain-containing protein [Elongatibacter sediminis]|uniref:Cupin domain-containing protein n=1 Tax=Elongatibacter sediminis TaxID=3119006 RepID=A0AAW9RB45_9GAMM
MAGHYPDRIRTLEDYDGRFDAYRLRAQGADVLFASYPAGTVIEPHTHDTDNHGIIIRGELILIQDGTERRYATGDWYHVPAGVEHAARFEQETDEIEIWFSAGPATQSPPDGSGRKDG